MQQILDAISQMSEEELTRVAEHVKLRKAFLELKEAHHTVITDLYTIKSKRKILTPTSLNAKPKYIFCL